MRWSILFWLLLNFTCVAQEKTDTLSVTTEPEWNTKNYTQEDKIYNRSVWTFADNPALAGFDRKLAIAYRFRARNLSMGVPNDNGDLILAFTKHEAYVDMSFGGPKQNWGIGIYYGHEQEHTHTYHRLELGQSHRIQFPKDHNLILGISFALQWSKLDDWSTLTFGDMIDPRAGFIYQTNEVNRHDSRVLAYFKGGLRYYWKRLTFDYSVQYGPHGTWALAAAPVDMIHNRLKAVYHIYVGDDVTLTPEISTGISTTLGVFYPNGPDAPWVYRSTNNLATVSGHLGVTYKDMVFGQLGMEEFNRLSVNAGYQLRDFLIIQIGCSTYTDMGMQRIGGLASIEASMRYQIKAWNK